MKDSPDLVASLVSQGKTGDPTGRVRLVKGNIECTSCHNPHVQAGDPINLNFLVVDSSNSQMCLDCHDPNRVVVGQTNHLAGWTNSIHATATNKTTNQPYVGGYGTVAQNGCNACHMPHNAPGRHDYCADRTSRTALPVTTVVRISLQPPPTSLRSLPRSAIPLRRETTRTMPRRARY